MPAIHRRGRCLRQNLRTLPRQVRDERRPEGRRVLHANVAGAADRGSDRAVSVPHPRSVLRVGRHVRAERGIRKQLDDEQLVILDILTRPSPPLTKSEREQVKRLARELLDTLKAERLVLEWRSRQQTYAAVFVAI